MPASERQRSRTKIIATIGPACREPAQMAALAGAGADVFRLNMAHGSLDEHAETLADIRRTSERLRQPIAVLVDLAGPKIRLGELPDDAIECAPDQSFRFVRGDQSNAADELTTTYDPLVDELNLNDPVMLADGTVGMVVVEKHPDWVRCRVTQPGLIRSRQGLNLPGVKLSAPALGEHDRENALWAAKHEIDFVGLSFVRHPDDVRQLKVLLRAHDSKARVVAKIEKPEALEQLTAIVDEADCLMVARGDLGVEIDVARMPVVQKQIIAACRERRKPVIIATQMLDSMQSSRRPTRAEVTDVANAILDGGDACMLSGETAIGKYPREAVAMMNQVALETEQLFRGRPPEPFSQVHPEGLHEITAAVVHGAAHIAAAIGAKLIVVASHSGATALALSRQRNYVPTVGISDSESVLRQMSLYWGVIPLADVPAATDEETLSGIAAWGAAAGVLAAGDYIVLVAGRGLQAGSHNQVTVSRV